MRTENYLGLVKKLNTLIENKELERQELMTLATKVTQTLSDMPKAPGTSDKVGNLSVKLVMKQQEMNHIIDVYVDLKNEIMMQIEKLPADEYDVLYRRYILNQSLFDIAEERNQSVAWIQKLAWRGMTKIKVMESESYNEACAKLFSK